VAEQMSPPAPPPLEDDYRLPDNCVTYFVAGNIGIRDFIHFCQALWLLILPRFMEASRIWGPYYAFTICWRKSQLLWTFSTNVKRHKLCASSAQCVKVAFVRTSYSTSFSIFTCDSFFAWSLANKKSGFCCGLIGSCIGGRVL